MKKLVLHSRDKVVRQKVNGFCIKNIKNEELWTRNEKLRVQNVELCIQKMMDFAQMHRVAEFLALEVRVLNGKS